MLLSIIYPQMDTDSDDEPMFPYNPEDDFDFSSVFNYENQFVTSPLLRAIVDGDVDSIKAQIQSGKDLNTRNNYGNTPLHAAAVQKSTEILNLILQQPDINLNFKNDMGHTPLLLSMKIDQPDNFIMYLLEAGCDVNIADNVEETPLHLAAIRRSACVALNLIKRDANINALDGNKFTALHHAVVSNNLELVCLLLHYNADVNVKCHHNLTPFMYAVNDRDRLEIARVLFNYYVDFTAKSSDGFNALLLAANSISPIAVDIAKANSDVNWITPQGNSVVVFALHYDNSELFKTIWAKLDHRNLLNTNRIPFLTSYASICRFPTAEWVECMYEILKSPFIVDLITDCTNYEKPYWKRGFFRNLIYTMFELKVKLSDRLAIIQLCLTFGAAVFISGVNLVNELYGFKEELEICIYCATLNKIDENDSYRPLPTFIFVQEENYSSEYIVKLFENEILKYRSRNDFLKALGFFSFSRNAKEILTNSDILRLEVRNEIVKKLTVIPEFPSLIELSRNQVRKNIKENQTIKRPYEFHDAVNNLHIPPFIKNIILFKTPIYG